MAAKSPRIYTALEPPLFRQVELLARREKVSLSQVVRDLVREALDLLEDEGLESLVEARRRRGSPRRWIGHDEVKRRLG